MLANNLIRRILFDAPGAFIPGNDEPIRVEGKDGVVLDSVDHQAEKLIGFALKLGGAVPIGGVPNDGGDVKALVTRDRAEADLDGKMRTIPPAPFQVQGMAHRAGYRVFKIAGAMAPVGISQVLRKQHFESLTEQLHPVVAKQALGHPVEEQDFARLVNFKYRIGSALKQFTESAFRVTYRYRTVPRHRMDPQLRCAIYPNKLRVIYPVF